MKPAALTIAALSLSLFAAQAAESGQQIYEKGRQALERGDLVTARRCFEKLLAAAPDYVPARAQLAMVKVREKEQARIPRSLKTARAQRVESFAVSGASLDETVTFFRRKLETAAVSAGTALPVNLTGVLPEAVQERAVSLKAQGVSYDHVLQAIGYAADVSFSYHAGGIAVSMERGGAEFPAGNAKEPTFQAQAGRLRLGNLKLDDANAAEAFAYLEAMAAKAGGAGEVRPFFVIRHDSTPRRGVTLDLRNVSLEEAVRAVCVVADLEETWFPWGAGIGYPRPQAAVPDSRQADGGVEAPAAPADKR